MKHIPLVIVLIALFGAAATYSILGTRRGVGVSPDSRVYLAAAQSVATGHGYADDGVPVTKWPPGYPLAIAAPTLVGLPMLASLRWVDALLFGALAATVGLIAWCADGTTLGAGLAGVIFLTARGIGTLGVMAWSESLGITLSLLALVLLVRHAAASAGAMAGAVLTRYALGAFWMAGVAALIMRREPKRALRWAALSVAPVVVWLARNLAIGGSATHRSLGWHPAPFHDERMGLAQLGNWVLIKPWTFAISCPVAIVALGLLAWIAWKQRSSLRGLLALAPLVYLAYVWLARTIADPIIPFDTRILSPTAACGAALAGALLGRLIVRTRDRGGATESS